MGINAVDGRPLQYLITMITGYQFTLIKHYFLVDQLIIF